VVILNSYRELTITLLTGMVIGLMIGAIAYQPYIQTLTSENQELKALYQSIQESYVTLQYELNKSQAKVNYLDMLVKTAGIGENLTLDKIAFYFSKPPNGELNPNATYERGDIVWIYTELSGFCCKKLNGTWAIDVIFCLRIFDVQGQLIWQFKPLRLNATYDEKPEKLWYRAWLRPSTPGTFIITLIAYDKISLKSTATSALLTIT